MATTEKSLLRKQYRARRHAIAPAQRHTMSLAIAERVLGLPELATAQTVFCYVGVGSEVETRALIESLWALAKVVAVPCVVGPGVMQPRILRNWEELVVDPAGHGIPAPRRGEILDKTPDVCLVPGVAFGPGGWRLGSGQGFYDRYLAAHRQAIAVGLCFEAQVALELPHEEHDVAMDLLVTESRTVRTK
ncbi:MAG: 5-formyltetrahydrofolate cyclo-ligase [Phycisphaeraceae bacterium]|nr:5-formyltetrahydrofolate cyclo-ligase [Phycisphaeraceae bacterium]